MAQDSKKQKVVKDDRTRTWAFVGYPESMPENWRETLDGLGVPWCRSPLHDKDVNETTGEPKKPHWHFVLSFEGVKSYEQVAAITSQLGGTIPQRCHSIRGAVRYMAHLDNPEKAQYNTTDIVAGMGFDLANALKLSATEQGEILHKLESIIWEKCVKEYADLAYWVCKYHPEYRETLMSHSYHLSQIVKSIRHGEYVVDLETGEPICGQINDNSNTQ